MKTRKVSHGNLEADCARASLVAFSSSHYRLRDFHFPLVLTNTSTVFPLMPKPYALAQAWLMDHLEGVVKHLFPAGRIQGNEFLVGDIDGSPGDSLHISLNGNKRGFWKDFATGAPGSRGLCRLWKEARKIDDTDH